MEIRPNKTFWVLGMFAVVVIAVGFVGGFLFSRNAYCPVPIIPPVVHYSPFGRSNFFDTAFREAQKTVIPESKTLIRGLTVNHHLLVPNLIARAFLTVKKQPEPDTILLISPNHFSAGRKNILLSTAEWQTPYGVTLPDQKTLDILVKNGLTIDEEPFEKEHGIFNIVAFIRHTFPSAKIVPIIIKESLKSEQSKKLAELMYTTLPKNTLVVLSADFSHYTTNTHAQVNDKKTIAVMQRLDADSVKDLAVDTRPGLELFLHLMKLYGAKNWTLLDNTNAEQILGFTPDEGVTSYINGFFAL